MKKKLFVVLFIQLLMTNCELPNKDRSNEKKQIRPENVKLENNISESMDMVFQERDKNIGNFLFLHFWLGMNSVEYKVISDSLINSKALFLLNDAVFFELKIPIGMQYYYPTEKFMVRPKFHNNSLVELNLIKDIDVNSFNIASNIITLYSTKYGTPKIERPEKSKIFVRDKEYYEYYEFSQHIWEEEYFYVVITIKYSIVVNDPFLRFTNKEFSEFVNQIESFIISYSSKKTFVPLINKEKKRKELEEKRNDEILKNQLDKI